MNGFLQKIFWSLFGVTAALCALLFARSWERFGEHNAAPTVVVAAAPEVRQLPPLRQLPGPAEITPAWNPPRATEPEQSSPDRTPGRDLSYNPSADRRPNYLAELTAAADAIRKSEFADRARKAFLAGWARENSGEQCPEVLTQAVIEYVSLVLAATVLAEFTDGERLALDVDPTNAALSGRMKRHFEKLKDGLDKYSFRMGCAYGMTVVRRLPR